MSSATDRADEWISDDATDDDTFDLLVDLVTEIEQLQKALKRRTQSCDRCAGWR